MVKKLIFVQIVFLILCSCSSFPLTDNKPLNINLDTLSQEENDEIKLSKTLFKNINSNWVQQKEYKNEKISTTFGVYLNRDSTLKELRLCNVFCADDLNNECKIFVINAKKTILKTFPIQDLLSINYDNWYRIHLRFGSKEGNKLFKES